MPELPEVERFKKYFDSTSLNKKIKNVKVIEGKILTGITPKKFESQIIGEKFKSTFRHGKYLFVKISDNKNVAMHFGMTGFLKYFKNDDESSKHIRILFEFSNRYKLGYDCQRKFGRVALIKNVDEFLKKKKLGIDPLNKQLSFKSFKEILNGKKGSIKSILMNQKIFSGIGNLYSDEILFHSNVHPSSSLINFNEKHLKKVYDSMKNTLKIAVDKKANFDDYPESWLVLFRRDDENCPKCSGKIRHKKIAGRTSYFCDTHQKKYKD